MRTFEQLVRYTTWFGAFSDAIIPLYLSIVLLTFSLWILLSYFLRREFSESIIGSDTYSDSNGFVFAATRSASSPAELACVAHVSIAGSSSILPLCLSTVAPSTHRMKIWTLRSLAFALSAIYWALHQEVVPRLKWFMLPSLYANILLYIVQWVYSSGSLSVLPGTCAAMVHQRWNQLWSASPPFMRRALHHQRMGRRYFYLQCAVAIVACGLVVYVFYTNEPLSKPVPKVGMPRKMCPLGSPTESIESVMRDYAILHKEMWKRPVKEQRILVYHTTNEGLGNRIEGLVSAFILAVVTDRAFVVDWRAQSKCNAELRDLFDNPGFDWEADWSRLRYDESKRQGFYYAYCRACPIRTRSADLTDTWDKLLCSPNAGFDAESRIVSIRSTQWFAPVLAMNPHLREKVCRLFGADMYGTVAPKLLKLNAELRARMDAFKHEARWTPETEVISLQIRRLEGFGISEDIADAFLRCASAITKDSDKAKYFLATDHIPTREAFKAYLGDRLIHMDSIFDRESRRGIQDAVLEMYLLGEASNMIMSPYSTFGDISHARTGLVPYKVGRNGQCTKQLTSHPCFFYYFGMFDLSCFNNDMILAELTNQEECYN